MTKDISLEDFLMACRYSYYVRGHSIVDDYSYDAIEKKSRLILPEESPIHLTGSSLMESYPMRIQQLAAMMT